MSTQREWEERVRAWLAAHVTLTAAGYPFFDPPAPDGIPENQRWANWFAYGQDDALNVAIVRMYGCRCVFPLLGWTVPPEWSSSSMTPRCRTCNTDVSSWRRSTA